MTATTCIRNADWVIGWDAGAESHQYLQGADVVFVGNAITFVGKGYDGAVDNEIDGVGRCVMPGLVDIHNHTSTMPVFKGVREELGNPRFYMSALYDGWNLVCPGTRGQGVERPLCLLRAAAVRGDHGGRYVRPVPRLARGHGRQRPARLPIAVLRLGPVVFRRRLPA
jgi:hypothetical protein